MKILHVLASNKFSGAENVACQIIKMFSDREPGIEMAYCSPKGEIEQALKKEKIDYYPLEKMSRKELRRVIKTYKPDIIHAHDMKSSFYSAISQSNIKIISHIHNSDFKARKFSIKSLLYKYASKKIKRIIWVSTSCLETYYFSNYIKQKSCVLKNVINKDELYEKAKNDAREYDFDIVYIGRLANPKNPLRLVEILSKVIKSNDSIKVGIVGSGDLEEATRAKAEEYGLNDNISFLGFCSNPYKILSSAKLMIMTSDREGLPMVALEAMAFGIPIVSTPTDGMNEIIVNSYNGYLCNEDDKFSNIILSLISDNNLRNEISNNVLTQFSEINNVENYFLTLKDVYEY